MMAMGGIELLVLLLAGLGDVMPDSVALVPPRLYFQARAIEPSLDKMMELAAKDPRDPKTQVQQLLALRHLEAEVEQLKKDTKSTTYRKTLTQIADGTLAADKLSFAKEYAQRVLARLDGKAPPSPPGQPVKAGLAWVPADATVVFGASSQAGTGSTQVNSLIDKLFKDVPPEAREELFGILDLVGNVRIERVSAGYAQDGQAKNTKSRIYLRMTGKARAEWLAEAFKSKANATIESTQGAKDEALVFINGPKSGADGRSDWPGMVIIGDTDFLIAGNARGLNSAAHREVLDKMLATRAGKQPDALQGTFKDRLAKVPADAYALLVADFAASGRNDPLLPGIPGLDKIDGFVQRTKQGLDVKGTATMTSPAQAENAVKEISQARKQGIDTLRQLQNAPPIAGLPIPEIINVLESLQLQQEAEKVQVQLVVTNQVLQSLPMLLAFQVRGVQGGGNAVQPPPVPKDVKK